MKPRHHTDTTYETFDPRSGNRLVITVLRLGTAWAYCVIETIPRNGRNVADALGNVPRCIVPLGIVERITATAPDNHDTNRT